MAKQTLKSSPLKLDNVAAALGRIESHSSQINTDHGTVARHIEELEEALETSQRDLASEKSSHESEVRSLKEGYTRDVANIKERNTALENKLRSVQGEINKPLKNE